MQVTVKFSDTIQSDLDLSDAWELFYLYQQGAKLAGEKITEERLENWKQVELALQNAEEDDLIDFSVMGNIYFENGKAGFKDDDVD